MNSSARSLSGVVGEPPHGHGTLQRLGLGGGQRLAHFGRHHPCDFRGFGIVEVSGLMEVAGSLGHGRSPITDERLDGTVEEHIDVGRRL